MKKLMTFTLTALLAVMSSKAQVIPNYFMENWDTRTVLNPEDWFRLGDATRVIDGQDSGIRMVYFPEFDMRPMISLGNELGFMPGNGVGQDYKDLPTKVRITCKYDHDATDSSEISLIFTKNILMQQTPILFGNFRIGGTSSVITTHTFNLNYILFDTTDEILISVAGPELTQGANGQAYFELYEIEFLNNNDDPVTAPNNAQFNNWINVNYEAPAGWVTIDDFTARIGIVAEGVVKSTASENGTYSARLENKDFLMGEILPGALMVAHPSSLNFDENVPTFGINTRYTELKANIKYDMIGFDSSRIMVNLFYNGNIVGNGYLALGGSDTTFNEVSVPIMYDSSFTNIPDSANLFILSGDFDNPEQGSYLHIDMLELFDNSTGISHPFITGKQFKVYPNPASNNQKINIEFTSHSGSDCKIKFKDLKGGIVKTLYAGHINKGINSIELDLPEANAGTYILMIESGSGTLYQKISILD